MRPIQPQPGSNPDPTDFVGRVRTSETARRKLLAGNNLALTDPRRMGKTFWMSHFCHVTPDFVPVIIDYEGVRTAEEFLLRTAGALEGHQGVTGSAKRLLRSFFDGMDEASIGLDSVNLGVVQIKVGVRGLSATDLLSRVVLAVDRHAGERPLLVCMDEVPLAIRNIARRDGSAAAREVLQALRGLRRETRRIRWIVAGSIGFHHVLRECGATEGDLNDLDVLPLGPLDPHEAHELALRLLLGINRKPAGDVAAELIERSGGIPWVLHTLASMLQENEAGPVTSAEVAATYDAFVDDRDRSRGLVHFLTRLDTNYGQNTELAKKVLDLTAEQTSPMTPAQIAETLGCHQDSVTGTVDHLLDDHYLSRHGDAVAWRYEVLRRIWLRRRWRGAGR